MPPVPGAAAWGRHETDADGTLAGSAPDLLLVFARRLPADRVAITGERALAEHWPAHTAA